MFMYAKIRQGLHLLLTLALAACSVGSLDEVTRAFTPPGASATGNSAISFTPVVHDFGLLAAGSGTATQVFTLTNTASQNIFVSSISGANTDFSIDSDTCPRSPTGIAPGSTCQATITFAPLSNGAKSMSLIAVYGVTVGDTSFTSTLGVSGTGVASLNFAGIDNITSVAATTLDVNWTHVPGAASYFVYTVSGGVLTYITDVNAPTASAHITGLTPGATYTFRVRALDVLGVWDTNVVDVMATMLNPGTFTAIPTLTTAEGSTSLTGNLDCTDQYANVPTYSILSQSDAAANCTISAAPERVSCSPSYKTGHSDWSSTVDVQCILNGQTFTRSVTVDVLDTNRSPDLGTASDQTISVLAPMTGVDPSDTNTSGDTDIDTDTILYSCTFTKDAGAVTACSSAALTGTFSLNTSTGAVAWTPGAGAITGENVSHYAFTITGSDQRPAPLTDTVTFTIHVTPINPVMTTITDRTFALGTALNLGDVLNVDINNVRDGAPGDDVSMSYVCTYDKLVDGAVASGTTCSTLSQFSFNAATGVISWTTDFDAFGSFEFKIVGTHATSGVSGSGIFIVDVRAGYPTAGLLGDYDAQVANLIGLPAIAYSSWKDLTALHDVLLPSFSSGGGWSGAATPASPSNLRFDATNGVNIGQALNGQTAFTVNAWVLPGAPTSASRVILSNNSGGDGFTLRQASDGSGKLDFLVGPEYSTYESIVLADSPIAYWRLGETSGTTAYDSSGANYCSGAPCHATHVAGVNVGIDGVLDSNIDKQALYPGVGQYTALPQKFSFAGDFSIEFWNQPDETAEPGPILGNLGHDDSIASYNSGTNLQLMACPNPGVPANCANLLTYGSKVAANLLYHVVVTRTGTAMALYRNGVLVDSDVSSEVFEFSYIGRGAVSTSAGTVRTPTSYVDEVAFYNTGLTPGQVKAHYDAGHESKYICRTSSALDSSRWKAVTLAYTPTTGLGEVYINGRSECSYASRATFDSTGDMYAGSDTSNSNRWTGRMADLKAYSGVSTTNITSIVDQTANRFRPNPLHLLYQTDALWKIDAASARDRVNPQTTGGCGTSEWMDISTTQSDGSLYGFNCTTASGWNGTGSTSDPHRLTMDGTNDYVDSGLSSNELDWYFTAKPRGVEVWAYLTGTTGNRPLFSAGDSTSNTLYILQVNAATNLWTFRGNTPSTTFSYDGHNKWAHYVLTTDGTTARAYVNGTQMNTRAGGSSTNPSNPFTVGRNNPDAGVAYWEGSIAYTAIYNRLLLPAEITALCNAMKERFAGVAGGVTCN